MKNILTITAGLILSLSLFAQGEKEYCERLAYSLDPEFAPFYHGVASGDALTDRVIIWTRVTPANTVDSIIVNWYVATDTLFTNIVNEGEFVTRENRDWTVKVDVDGLEPDTWYYYYFHAMEQNSIIGRTRTLPAENADSLRIAVFSGSNYNNGFFNVYRSQAERNDVDMVFHLGDYIYEYGTGEYGDHSDRELVPSHETLTLADYRMRYSHYRLDPDLRLNHQQYPWYVIYDDHETANNSWTGGAENHSGDEGDWETRKSAGIQAFMEWIPIREVHDVEHPENHIHREFRVGDLATFIMLDTRLEGRDDPEGLDNDDPSKSMLGDAQKQWMKDRLLSAQFTTGIQWKMLTQQVMFAPLKIMGITLNSDQWDGYEVERQEILNYLYGMGIHNTVVLTGDIHTSWANDVPNPTLGEYGDNGQGSGCVEFVTPSVTSPSVDFGQSVGSWAIQSANPHIKWVNLVDRGYFILDVNTTRCQADWFFVNTIDEQNYVETFNQGYYVNDGETFLRSSSVPAIRMTPNPPFAPQYPDHTVDVDPDLISHDLVIMGVYPNPVEESFTLQYFAKLNDIITLEIFDMAGNRVYLQTKDQNCADLNYMNVNMSEHKDGMYLLKLSNQQGFELTKKIIKTR